MLSKKRIKELLGLLNEKLKIRNEKGEIGLVGGTVMCLVYDVRAATKDIDAIFVPTQIIRQLAAEIAEEESLPEGWINDGAKAYIRSHFQRRVVLNLSNLLVWSPEPKYMLAMKCISARWDTSDKDDVIFLIKHLKLGQAEDVFEIIEQFYPKSMIPPKAKFFVEEVFADLIK